MIKIRKRGRRNVARGLPRPAPFRTGEDEQVLKVSYRLRGPRDQTTKISKAFLTLKRTRYPGMTLPEGIAFNLLQAKQVEFIYQKDYASGRTYRGGAVIDFWLPDLQTVLRIQGDYWHTRPEARERDEVQRSELLQSMVDGKRVANVVDIWESRLRSCQREQVITAALNGQELGRA